jgi:hypothetical protein
MRHWCWLLLKGWLGWEEVMKLNWHWEEHGKTGNVDVAEESESNLEKFLVSKHHCKTLFQKKKRSAAAKVN